MSNTLTKSMKQGHLKVVKDANHLELLSVKAKLKCQLTDDNGVVLFKKGEQVLVRELIGQSKNAIPLYEVAGFSKQEGTSLLQPESWLGELTLNQTHIVPVSSAKETFLFNNQHYLRRNENLFPEDDSPNINEIKQGRISCCFLLAAIQSILTHPQGKAFIRGMMSQNGNNTTVRLFNPKTKQFELITVENSILIDRFGSLNSHKGLWVHILENAYAIMATRTNSQNNSALSAVYSGGGQRVYAVEVLTGMAGETVYSPEPIYQFSSHFTEENFNKITGDLASYASLAEQNKANLFASSFSDPATITAAFSPMSEEEANQALYRLFLFYSENHRNEEAMQLYEDAIKNQSFNALKSKFPEIAEILKKIMKPNFSGNYSKDELAVFNKIKTGLSEGKLVTAGTHPTADWRSNLKTLQEGISRQHAYTVLKVFSQNRTTIDANGQPQTKPVKFVQLRNPWGRWGRVYQQHNGNYDIKTGYQYNKDTFIVELHDYCRYFSNTGFNQAPNTLVALDTMRETLLQKINTTLQEWGVSYNSSIEELLIAQSNFKACEALVLKTALMELNFLPEHLLENLQQLVVEKEMSEAQKKALFTAQLEGYFEEKPNFFYWIQGGFERITDRLYSLSYYQTYTSLEKPLEELKFQIVHATPKPANWELLEEHQSVLKMIVSNYNSDNNLLENFNKLHQKLFDNSQKFVSEYYNTQHIGAELRSQADVLMVNLIKLKELYSYIINNNLLTNQFNSSLSPEELDELIDKMNKLEAIINDVDLLATLRQSLEQDIRETLAQAVDCTIKRELNPETLKQIQTLTAMLAPSTRQAYERNYAQTINDTRLQANTLKKDKNPKVQNVGDKLLGVADKAEKEVSLFKSLCKRLRLSAPVQCLRSIKNQVCLFFGSKNQHTLDACLAPDYKPSLSR